MIKLLLYFSYTLLLFSSCNQFENDQEKEILIGNLMLTIKDAKLVVRNGSDSYAAWLISPDNDTFAIEYGEKNIINNLYEPNVSVFPMHQKSNIDSISAHSPTKDEVVFSEYPEEDESQRIFETNYFFYDTVNNIIMKIVHPKKIGFGITGMYIPKLNNGKSFSIYATNLDSNAHISALKMFRSIKYYQ